MKAFQIVQDLTALFGIYPADEFNYIKMVLFYSSKIITFVASISYFIFKANSIDEFGETFYVCITIVAEFVSYTAFATKVRGMTKLIQKFREIVYASELNVNFFKIQIIIIQIHIVNFVM